MNDQAKAVAEESKAGLADTRKSPSSDSDNRTATSDNTPQRETAILAGGCFWGIEHLFRKLEGVVDVTSGFMGGSVVEPSYEEVCSGLTGHKEVVLIAFDPRKISYEQLVKYFFEIHDPTDREGQGPDRGEQYLSAIFYFSLEQKKIGADVIKTLDSLGIKAQTQLHVASVFYPADEYHQRYYTKTGKTPYCHRYVKRFP
jgi:peptide methionine sulfoxide reductase msrA/msrB